MPEQYQNLPFVTETAHPTFESPPNLQHRILVVDHDPYVRHLNADALIRHGYEVNAVEDGNSGWNELQACDYDLLITEDDLPEMTGIELVRKVRSARMALPVVMATGRLPVRALILNRSLQLAAALMKPLPVNALLDTVKCILRATDRLCECVEPSAGSSGPGWLSKLNSGALTTTRSLQEVNIGHRSFAYWGLNE